MASAENVRSPIASTEFDGAAPKRILPRVTNCRCGDPQPADNQPDQ
jgi:hypothetical protein